MAELLPLAGPSGVRELALAELESLLAYGAASRLTVFELFEQAILLLKERGETLRVSGQTLRSAAQRYELGGDRVAALLPVEKVALASLGVPRDGFEGELEVRLAAEHGQFLELADIRLSQRYGFRSVRRGEFADGFGASVRRLVFSFNLDRIELYEPAKIAIYVRGFGQPKRWRIPRIAPK